MKWGVGPRHSSLILSVLTAGAAPLLGALGVSKCPHAEMRVKSEQIPNAGDFGSRAEIWAMSQQLCGFMLLGLWKCSACGTLEHITGTGPGLVLALVGFVGTCIWRWGWGLGWFHSSHGQIPMLDFSGSVLAALWAQHLRDILADCLHSQGWGQCQQHCTLWAHTSDTTECISWWTAPEEEYSSAPIPAGAIQSHLPHTVA